MLFIKVIVKACSLFLLDEKLRAILCSLELANEEEEVLIRCNAGSFGDILNLVGLEGFCLDEWLCESLVDSTVRTTKLVTIIGPI